jgi:spore photoproduct lyase
MFSIAPNFSQIFCEPEIGEYPLAQEILTKFNKSHLVSISRYQEVFNRTRQNFRDTKLSQKIILAKKNAPFLYESSEVIQGANPRFFYTTPILNCLYDCDYCFLQGKFNSAHAVIFVNAEDYFEAVRAELKNGPLTVSPSYETDLLGFSGVCSWFSKWIEFARNREDLSNEVTVELRSKSGSIGPLDGLEPTNNVVLSWTVSPDEIAKKYERSTPSLEARLKAAQYAAAAGWRVRLCIDPVLAVNDWKDSYINLISVIKNKITAPLEDIWIGSFRISTEHLAKIKSQRGDSDILFYPFSKLGANGDIAGYPDNIRLEINQIITKEIADFVPREKVVIW